MLLDNYGIMNTAFPYSFEVLADNYYLTDNDWSSLNSTFRNYYIWQKEDQSAGEWTTTYRVVFYANVVLDRLSQIEDKLEDRAQASEIKGAALFFRGFAFYALAQIFAPPYDNTTAAQALGIPLRLSSDLDKSSVRASLQQTYDQIISDLKTAAALLPPLPSSPNRPSKAAAFAALARTYLTIEDYSKAGLYADSSLQIYSTLLDFNDLNPSASTPFSRFNKEVIFPAVSSTPAPLNPSRAKVDTALYASYATGDLRRILFFKTNANGSKGFKGSYDGSSNGSVFSGLTTSELYLVKAEVAARQGNIPTAIETLNTLLQSRWEATSFTPLAAQSPEEALALILAERRKELCFRGQRWTDLRRLNTDSRFATTLHRKVNNEVISLPPNSPRYTLLIPQQVIELTGMPQNQ
jgi:hypothetical protein